MNVPSGFTSAGRRFPFASPDDLSGSIQVQVFFWTIYTRKANTIEPVKVSARRSVTIAMLVAASAAQLLTACRLPFQWNADIKKFVDDGRSTLTLSSFTAGNGGTTKTVIPSASETVVTLNIDNPRSIELACEVGCADESLFDALPRVSVPNPTTVAFAFTPSLRAERRDLVFTVRMSSPEIDHAYDPATLVIHCNTPPRSVADSLNAALDAAGCAFAAFKLPSSPTDDDLAQVRITYAPAEDADSLESATFRVEEACVCAQVLSVAGIDILGGSDPLNRYYRPDGLSTGDNYVFSVVVIDSEGLESEAASISSDAATYSVIYDGNGYTGGTAPTAPMPYRHTKTVTVLGGGTLTRDGYTFAGWNTASDGTGTAYAVGDSFPMGTADVTLYAQWTVNEAVVVTFILNPDYESIVFSPSTVTVARGAELTLSTALAGASEWHWYVDDALQAGQTSSTFVWDSTGAQPGQYIVNVDAVYGGFTCTGSIRVTVTY